MDVKTNELTRYRRKIRGDDDDKWECSVCTYINPSESYKCQICFMRKGTSTRKPRLNPQVLEQQQLIAQAILKEKDEDHRKKKPERSEKQSTIAASLKMRNVDRSSPLLFEVFANGYSVVITEFRLKSKSKPASFPESPSASNCSSLQGFSGTPNGVPDHPSPTDSIATLDTLNRIPSLSDYDVGDSVESKVQTSHKSSGRCADESFPQVARPNSRARCSSRKPCSTVDGKHKQTVENIRGISGMGNGDSCVKSRRSRGTHSVDRRKASSRRVHSVYQSKNVLKRLRIERFQSSPLVLRSERLLSAAGMNTISSQLDHEECRTGSTTKRRKRCSGVSEPRSSGPVHKRFKLSSESDHSSFDHPWSTVASSKVVKERPLRITVKNLKPSFTKSGKSVHMVSKNKKSERQTFSSTSPSELKCKIRMIRSPTRLSQAALASDACGVSPSMPTSQTADNTFSHYEPAGNVGEASLEVSSVEPQDAANVASRMSTESRNTSAMTDSSGATALEMSR